MSIDRTIRRVADELRTWNGVAVIGAGASLLAGLPLLAQLRPLLWEALDADPALGPALATQLGQPWGNAPGAAKALVGDDDQATRLAFRLLAGSEPGRARFQHAFTRLDTERTVVPSPAHDALAELLHRRHVEAVVSPNWDTLLEAAYRRRYGRALRAEGAWLHKPHGDAARPDEPWMYPGDPGVVPAGLVAQINALALDHPRVLLIVGYSERDEVVVERLIRPLEARWRVVRVGPGVTGEWDLPLTADEALPALLRAVATRDEAPGWEYVVFDPQRDLGPALCGERLGPHDVVACPTLPEVATLDRQLTVAHSARLVGGTGEGKSVTAYQVAYGFHERDWEVVRLADPHGAADALGGALAALPYRTLALVDDAQAVPPATLRRLAERASPERKVLLVSTDQGGAARRASATDVVLAAERAVSVLSAAFAARREETLVVVRALDDGIGESYLSTPLDERLAEAGRQPTAWQFAFALTGGWRRARDRIAALREADGADLLLAAVAALQLTSLDAGATADQLEGAARVLGRDLEWLAGSLELLARDRLIVRGATVRCAHLRFAAVTLHEVCAARREPVWSSLLALFRWCLAHHTPDLRGVSWLLHELRFHAGAFEYAREGTAVDDATWARIVERCWTATDPEARAGALVALKQLAGWHPGRLDEIAAHAALFARWIDEAEPVMCDAAFWFLNNLSQERADVAHRIAARVDARVVAAKVTRFGLAAGYQWGALIRGFCTAGDAESRARLEPVAPAEALLALAGNAGPDDLWHLTQMAKAAGWMRPGLDLAMLARAAPAVAARLSAAPVQAVAEFEDGAWEVLGYLPRFLRARGPTAAQRRIARAIVRRIDPAAVADAVSRARWRDFQPLADLLFLIREASRRHHAAIVARVDFTRLDQTTQGLWSAPDGDLDTFLAALVSAPGLQPARDWAERHAPEFDRVGLRLPMFAPIGAVAAFHSGGTVEVDVSGSHWWMTAGVLAEVAEADRGVAEALVHMNRDAFAAAFVLEHRVWDEGLPLVLHVLEAVAPRELDAILAAVDAGAAERHWAERLQGGVVDQRAARALLAVAARADAPIGEVASRLLKAAPRRPVRRKAA